LQPPKVRHFMLRWIARKLIPTNPDWSTYLDRGLMSYQRAVTVGAPAIRFKRQRARHSETRIVFNLKKDIHPGMTREMIDYLLIRIPSAFTVRKMKKVLHVLLRYLGEEAVKCGGDRVPGGFRQSGIGLVSLE
jgi:hypothetical protein